SAPDRFDYSGAARGKLRDLVELEGGAAGGPVDTLRAVSKGIHLDAQSAMAGFGITQFDRLVFSYQHGFYSDANSRNTVRAEYGHRVLKDPAVNLGVETTLDDTRKQ